MVAQDPPSLAPSPWRREEGWSQHPWTGVNGSPRLGVLQVGPRQRQQASLQLDSNCFSFTFSTGKRGALGVRVKSNITNALWSMMDCCSSKSPIPEWPCSCPSTTGGITWEPRGQGWSIAPTGFVPDQQSQVTLLCNKSQLLFQSIFPHTHTVFLHFTSLNSILHNKENIHQQRFTNANTSTIKNASLTGTGLCALGRTLQNS